jgi:hypothetical protein
MGRLFSPRTSMSRLSLSQGILHLRVRAAVSYFGFLFRFPTPGFHFRFILRCILLTFATLLFFPQLHSVSNLVSAYQRYEHSGARVLLTLGDQVRFSQRLRCTSRF